MGAMSQRNDISTIPKRTGLKMKENVQGAFRVDDAFLLHSIGRCDIIGADEEEDR